MASTGEGWQISHVPVLSYLSFKQMLFFKTKRKTTFKSCRLCDRQTTNGNLTTRDNKRKQITKGQTRGT